MILFVFSVLLKLLCAFCWLLNCCIGMFGFASAADIHIRPSHALSRQISLYQASLRKVSSRAAFQSAELKLVFAQLTSNWSRSMERGASWKQKIQSVLSLHTCTLPILPGVGKMTMRIFYIYIFFFYCGQVKDYQLVEVERSREDRFRSLRDVFFFDLELNLSCVV